MQCKAYITLDLYYYIGGFLELILGRRKSYRNCYSMHVAAISLSDRYPPHPLPLPQVSLMLKRPSMEGRDDPPVVGIVMTTVPRVMACRAKRADRRPSSG